MKCNICNAELSELTGYCPVEFELNGNVHAEHMAKQIAELQEKLSVYEKRHNEHLEIMHKQTDKLHRRNLQIAELKKKLRLAYNMGIESTYSPAKGRSRDKQIDKIIGDVDLPQE